MGDGLMWVRSVSAQNAAEREQVAKPDWDRGGMWPLGAGEQVATPA